MKNVSSLKSTKSESPKTPGGISKSLLTPCRRLGLSRKWKNPGSSPFISPITTPVSGPVEAAAEKKGTRKRKIPITNETKEEMPQKHMENDIVLDIDENKDLLPSIDKNKEIVDTPSRNVEIPRKKRSKVLTSAINNSEENPTQTFNIVKESEDIKNDPPGMNDIPLYAADKEKSAEPVSTPVRVKSMGKKKFNSPLKSIAKLGNADNTLVSKSEENEMNEKYETNIKTKKRSPRNLTKECMVVLQKKMFKTNNKTPKKLERKPENTSACNEQSTSQVLFDSDSDELPINCLNKKENIENLKMDSEIMNIDDDDFTDTTKVKVKKLEDKNTSTGDLKMNKKKSKKKKLCTQKETVKTQVETLKTLSQSSNSFDDDEDFDFENKRTILIRKCYDKVAKPLKAKSTGSVTQRDIDDLKRRIEMKKKLLLAKAITKDTEELRGLIKKWQKGCQDALMELMELMKSKFPDRQHMDYSEILQMLRIPVNLVGYDSENDCFNTPDDADIILSKFNDNM